MATAYADGEIYELEMIEKTEDPPSQEVLASKTPGQRVQWLRREFYRSEQAIHNIAEPELCQVYPMFKNEVIAAYLQHTTFTAKVIVNYDSACKQFFTDSRAQGCGKLVLNKKARQQLERVRSPTIQINRVELEVGTTFRTLTKVVLRVNSLNGEVKAIHKPVTGDHPLFMKFLSDVCAELSGQVLANEGDTGMTINDLETIATWFVRQRQEEKAYRGYRRWNEPDEWTTSLSGFNTPNRGYMAHLTW